MYAGKRESRIKRRIKQLNTYWLFFFEAAKQLTDGNGQILVSSIISDQTKHWKCMKDRAQCYSGISGERPLSLPKGGMVSKDHTG